MPYDDECEQQREYAKLLKRPEWRAKRAEILAKSPRCQRCGRTNQRFAIHHPDYDYGRLPWDYPDDAYMVVCSGRCHREADREREEQRREAEDRARYENSWQYELGKKEQMPGERELRRLAKHEAQFKAWLIQKGYPPEPWDWNDQMWPLWRFWNHFADEFLAEQQNDNRQGLLNL